MTSDSSYQQILFGAWNCACIVLQPNSTNIIQPLDVSFFRTFKAEWQKINKMICDSSSNIGVKKYQFALVLKRTLDAMDTKKLWIHTFKKCGLGPFNVNAIDFTKVFQRYQDPLDSGVSMRNFRIMHNFVDLLQVVKSLLTKDKLEAFRLNEDYILRRLRKDESLFEMRYNLSHPGVDIAASNSEGDEVNSTSL